MAVLRFPLYNRDNLVVINKVHTQLHVYAGTSVSNVTDIAQLNNLIDGDQDSAHELKVYNMLITTLFLMFVLTTLALLIFLLMRRPICCSNCRDPLNQGEGQAQTDSQQDEQDGITYLVETHGVVMKKRMWDSPPPYESPPDYLSLSPEIIMNAKKLYRLNASNTSIATLTSKTMHNVMPMVHCTNSPTLCGHGKESPVSTTPLVAGTGAIPPFPENRKISLPYPPNKPPRLNRALSSPSSMPPTPVIQPPPHYDTIQAIIEEQQKSETINIDKSSTKS